ncbi:hypothetical protein CANINC_001326 [Pichia inconspicua]|uniref:Potassium transport protein n=1 Tax=Pichia inconspicua TaxID=52247 RepID=A0A4T0X568_9ASCO|nr:hypothetical protein CANINC_001326 [[Candida] inconspicua]
MEERNTSKFYKQGTNDSQRFKYSPDNDPPQSLPSSNKSQQNGYTTRLKNFVRKTFHNDADSLDDRANTKDINIGVGLKIRKIFYKIEEVCAPVVKKVIPNFIIAHYVYLLLWIILGSIIMYPERNMEYIDILMFITGACTQGGLATRQLNDLKLYQQIVIYVACMFTTPIFIHGSLTFIRLYWYEKRFDDIQENSIMQYKMRRQKTIANLRSKTRSMTLGMMNQDQKRDYESHNAQEGLTTRMKRFEIIQQQSNKNKENNTSSDSSAEKKESNSSASTGSDKNQRNIETLITNVNYNDNINSDQMHIPPPKPSRLSSQYEPTSDFNNRLSTDDTFDVDVFDSENDLSEGDVFEDEMENDEDNSDIVESDDDNDDDNVDNRGDGYHYQKYVGKTNDMSIPENSPSTANHLPNIKFGELPKPDKKKAVGSTGPKNSIYKKNLEDIEEETRRRFGRKKYRRLLKERKLNKLKKKSLNSRNNQPLSHPFMSEIDENHVTDYFSIPKKNARSLSVPLADKPEIHITPKVDVVSNNNGKFPHSHTIHMPELSRKVFSNFDISNLHDKDSDKIEGNNNNNDNDNFNPRSFLRNRRASFFGKTWTGTSRRNSNLDPNEMSDEEFIDNYVTKVPTNYLSWNPTVGRNSKFIALSSQQKQELGGVEYQSMKLLCKIVSAYYIGFHILAIVFFVPFAATKKSYQPLLREDGISPTWWAFFTSMSSFNDLGYSLNSTSMVLFAQNAYVLIVSAVLIIIGNTAFPIALRFIIWLMRLFTRPLTMTHNSLSFLLDHPRRCFTLLFPSGPTWWLGAVLVFLNCFDWILFIILDYGKPVLSYLPHGYQVLDGLYQSIATRTAGFNVVDLAVLHPAIQLSYMVMMYISVLPLAISIRRTNVYEEQSLGVYSREEEADHDGENKLKFIGAHLRKQLSFDLWFLFLAIFIICIAEGNRIMEGDIRFGIFQIMFEVTSAYGTVGLSLGYPNSNASFCGQFSKISKLVIIATLIRGRHRGLPNSIDRAIMLSGEKLNLRDDLEAYHAMRRANSINSDDIDMESMFPTLSRVVTANRPNIERQPTISENLRDGNIPWSDIVKKTGKYAGKLASNFLTVRGTPVSKYSRQFTQYNGYAGSAMSGNRSRRSYSDQFEQGYQDNQEVNHSQHNFNHGLNEDHENDDNYEISIDSQDEHIPLNNIDRSNNHDEDEMHGDFIHRMHNSK